MSSNAIRKQTIEHPVTLDLIKTSDYQKEGSKTAQLRQKIVTKAFYNSKQSANDLTDSIFDNADFGYAEQEFESTENRVAFLNVPENITPEEVIAKLAATPKARIYKILSNYPILTQSQQYAINQGLRTKDEFANSQVARYGENTSDASLVGKLVLQDGKPQYRATFFSAKGAPDVDLRSADPADFYTTPEIYREMTGEVMEEDFANLGNVAESVAEQTM